MFDFGLAKELKEEDRTSDGLYKLTGFTGSIRYMAPEVGLRRPYNEKVDVYSFSMLLWYILALEPPYGFYTPEMFTDRVFYQGHRPVTFPEWPEQIQIMMKRSWDNRVNVRPTFQIIMQVIKKETGKIDSEAAGKMLPFIS
jgi:serine/threonine protein kinase